MPLIRIAPSLMIVGVVGISLSLTDSLHAQTAGIGGTTGGAATGAARGTTGTTGTGITGGATQAGGGGTAAGGAAAAGAGINTGAGGGDITVDFGGGFVGRSQNAGTFIGGNQNAGGGAGGGRVATPNFGATTNNQFSAARGGATAGRGGATTGRASSALNNLLRGGGGGLGGTTSRGVFRPRQRIAFSFPPRASSVISSRVTTKVANVMVQRPQLSGVNVQVADGGVVTLNGQVDSEATKKLAGFLVLMEPGVRSIENDLVVEPTLSTDVAPPAIP